MSIGAKLIQTDTVKLGFVMVYTWNDRYTHVCCLIKRICMRKYNLAAQKLKLFNSFRIKFWVITLV